MIEVSSAAVSVTVAADWDKGVQLEVVADLDGGGTLVN